MGSGWCDLTDRWGLSDVCQTNGRLEQVLYATVEGVESCKSMVLWRGMGQLVGELTLGRPVDWSLKRNCQKDLQVGRT